MSTRIAACQNPISAANLGRYAKHAYGALAGGCAFAQAPVGGTAAYALAGIGIIAGVAASILKG